MQQVHRPWSINLFRRITVLYIQQLGDWINYDVTGFCFYAVSMGRRLGFVVK